MKMDTNLIAALAVIFTWGMWGFFFKIGTAKIGFSRAIFWGFLAFLASDIVIVSYLLLAQKTPIVFESGALYMIFGSIVSTIGALSFIFYLRKAGAGVAIPLTALYPAVSTILAVLVLKEKIKLVNAAGILLAIAAGVLLSL